MPRSKKTSSVSSPTTAPPLPAPSVHQSPNRIGKYAPLLCLVLTLFAFRTVVLSAVPSGSAERTARVYELQMDDAVMVQAVKATRKQHSSWLRRVMPSWSWILHAENDNGRSVNAPEEHFTENHVMLAATTAVVPGVVLDTYQPLALHCMALVDWLCSGAYNFSTTSHSAETVARMDTRGDRTGSQAFFARHADLETLLPNRAGNSRVRRWSSVLPIVVNVVLHLAVTVISGMNASCLVLIVLKIMRNRTVSSTYMCDEQGRRDAYVAGCWIGALVAGVHPARASVVAWVACSPYMWSALFALLAVWSYVYASLLRKAELLSNVCRAVSLALYTAAVLCKATAIPVVVVFIGIDALMLSAAEGREWSCEDVWCRKTNQSVGRRPCITSTWIRAVFLRLCFHAASISCGAVLCMYSVYLLAEPVRPELSMLQRITLVPLSITASVLQGVIPWSAVPNVWLATFAVANIRAPGALMRVECAIQQASTFVGLQWHMSASDAAMNLCGSENSSARLQDETQSQVSDAGMLLLGAVSVVWTLMAVIVRAIRRRRCWWRMICCILLVMLLSPGWVMHGHVVLASARHAYLAAFLLLPACCGGMTVTVRHFLAVYVAPSRWTSLLGRFLYILVGCAILFMASVEVPGELNAWSSSSKLARHVLARDPSHADAQVALASLTLWSDMGDRSGGDGTVSTQSGAKDILDAIAGLDRSLTGATIVRADVLVLKGILLSRLCRPDEAYVSFRRALDDVDSDCAQANYYMLMGLAKLSHIEQCRACQLQLCTRATDRIALFDSAMQHLKEAVDVESMRIRVFADGTAGHGYRHADKSAMCLVLRVAAEASVSVVVQGSHARASAEGRCRMWSEVNPGRLIMYDDVSHAMDLHKALLTCEGVRCDDDRDGMLFKALECVITGSMWHQPATFVKGGGREDERVMFGHALKSLTRWHETCAMEEGIDLIWESMVPVQSRRRARMFLLEGWTLERVGSSHMGVARAATNGGFFGDDGVDNSMRSKLLYEEAARTCSCYVRVDGDMHDVCGSEQRGRVSWTHIAVCMEAHIRLSIRELRGLARHEAESPSMLLEECVRRKNAALGHLEAAVTLATVVYEPAAYEQQQQRHQHQQEQEEPKQTQQRRQFGSGVGGPAIIAEPRVSSVGRGLSAPPLLLRVILAVERQTCVA